MGRTHVTNVWSTTKTVTSLVVADLYDREKSTSRMAAQAPWWTTGTASGYHAMNVGHLVGEVIRRVSGRTLPGGARRSAP